ncbi:hypothetical protein ACFQ1E_08435 [Sphingomonas canadensis]|uniref:Chorismate lyase n=1 Tax=Sphingomonas canadensis TaxID=1219257 RepID=A0ABW3H4E1_9SPHN|nr:hypothetical protein [Sphingomonas canadensis]MCW3836065.1 hypothetical protein [Sphingomonas canadensis]
MALAALLLAVAPPREDPVARLNADLLGSRSATAVLEHWCAAGGLADPPRIRADVKRARVLPVSGAQRRLLQVGRREMLGYRRVRLMCGDHVLSEAVNWYVPSRLTPEMNAALDGGDTPFGAVIRPLEPTRRTLSVRKFWNGRGVAKPTVLRHRALVLDSRGRPLAQVIEDYKRVLVTGRD